MSRLQSLLAENRAIYLPAIPETYARFAHGGSFTQSLPIRAEDLNFLDPENPVFHYPVALYSAGQAAPLNGAGAPPCMVTERCRSQTIVLGDSGGFQIQNAKIKFDRQNTATEVLRWLEQVADWSMVLDFPTGGINTGAMRKHVAALKAEGHDLLGMSRATGLSTDFMACLVQTEVNIQRFLAERTPGATRFLNVLQGRNEAESKHWYDTVKGYAFDGWAFAGAHKDHFGLILRRLLDMRNEGLLQKCDWLHVLGISTLPIGCLLTAVQRAVREFVNPRFQISFDSASPFRTGGNKSIVVGQTMDDRGWTIQSLPVSRLSALENDRTLFDVLSERLAAMRPKRARRRVAETYIGKSITLGELRAADGDISPDGYWLLMHHNMQASIKAHQDAHGMMFDKASADYDPVLVPFSLKTIEAAIRMAFSGKANEFVSLVDPYTQISEWEPWLKASAK